MPHPKSKTAVGLGNTLMNDRFGRGKGSDRRRGNNAGGATSAVTRTHNSTGEAYITNTREEAAWVKMRSVTEQGDLDEFLATAELAGTDFTAEKMNNVKIIHTDQKNPYLLSANEERVALKKHKENRNRLTVPRRPKWDESTTPVELDALERQSFLDWRRGLAELQENKDLLMTPFERNLEVWRQLWRVIERSDLVVQIVDARNPLLFRSEDLEDYVKQVDSAKNNLLLINKADMMTQQQRKTWADYLKSAGIAYRFFSASLAKQQLEGIMEDESESEEEYEFGKTAHDDQDEVDHEEEVEVEEEKAAEPTHSSGSEAQQLPEEDEEDDETRILTVEQLEDIFLQHAPQTGEDQKLTVGLVGYPNVGKSSTINALIGAKKVSVSSTPGKTKHFQTIHLSERVVLCDCPGLVFPNFATTKGDLVCNGILPIDQLREFQGPAGLVAQRIPKTYLESLYSITIRLRPTEEGGSGTPTASELLRSYARARGFQTQGQGNPDESRAARYILKDYVNGKLLYCEPPPGDFDPFEFNQELYDPSHLSGKRRLALAAAMDTMSMAEGDDGASAITELDGIPLVEPGRKSRNLDKSFFGAGSGNAGHVSRPFNYKYSEQGQVALGGKHLSGRKARMMVALEKGIDPKDVLLNGGGGKKHFKGTRKVKGKTVPQNVDDDP